MHLKTGQPELIPYRNAKLCIVPPEKHCILALRLGLPGAGLAGGIYVNSGEVSRFQFPIFGSSGDFGNLCVPLPLPGSSHIIPRYPRLA